MPAKSISKATSAMPTRTLRSNSTKRESKPPTVLNYDKLGGNLATENLTIDEVEMKLCGNLGNSNYKLYIAEADAPLYLNWTADGWIYLANKKAKDPDLLTWDQAMRDYPNLKEWMAAIAKEIRQLEEK